MSTEVLRCEPARPDAAVVARAAEALAAGEPIVLPTDTVYGLACRADDEAAVRRLFAVKRRSVEKALPLLLADAGALATVAVEVSSAAERLAEAFWPGALTLVVRKAAGIPDLVTGGKDTVGVRVPDSSLARAILGACAFPVAVTSANLANEPPAVCLADLADELREAVALIVDGGRCPGGTASTVVDVTVEPPLILRQGPITSDELQRVFA